MYVSGVTGLKGQPPSHERQTVSEQRWTVLGLTSEPAAPVLKRLSVTLTEVQTPCWRSAAPVHPRQAPGKTKTNRINARAELEHET